jgi:type II secretory pathway pseudopilin PulG
LCLGKEKTMNTMNQNGRSMIEMLGVLAIIGVLSVGGIAGYSKAMLKYKTNKTIDQITMLTTNIRTLYAQQKYFTGVSTTGDNKAEPLIDLGVVPDEMVNTPASGKKTLMNPFSGLVDVIVDASVLGAAGANRAFIIGVNGIPKEACMAIAASDWGSNYSSGLIGMALSKDNDSNKLAIDILKSDKADGTATTGVFAGCTGSKASSSAGTPVSGVICATHMPIKVANASTLCDCDGSQCSVAFKYY